MIYAKPPLTYEQQADQLLQRGMVGDRALIIQRLTSVNYYRLSGYWFTFCRPNDTFEPGTSFDIVWERYRFDRRLRLLMMDAIERIEVAVRTQLAYLHSHWYGPFAYAGQPLSLPNLTPNRHTQFLDRLQEEVDRSQEMFVDHFYRKYGDSHASLPVWMATEVMAFGSMLSFFRGTEQDIKREIARKFAVPDVVLESWLLHLNTVRNICAHHGRFWNRELGNNPLLPTNATKHPQWFAPVRVPNRRAFVALTICKYCLDRIAPQSRWANRVKALLEEFPGIPRPSMGFPANWEQCPIWADSHQEDYAI